MKNEVIAPLEKNRIQPKDATEGKKESGCCGGAPENDTDACCKLDEHKKAEGEQGCGCDMVPESAKGCC